ncbi:uncharacterized, partial [Tachysurus ichikawai]
LRKKPESPTDTDVSYSPYRIHPTSQATPDAHHRYTLLLSLTYKSSGYVQGLSLRI